MGERIHGRVVTPAGVIAHGYLETAGDRIAAVGPAGTGAPRRPPTGWLVPGFVDLHCHGGGGHSFVDGDPAAARAAAAYHRGHGTTTLLASLVTAPVAALAAATRALGPLVDAGVLAGLHYEGPYLARARRGAHDPAHLRDPAEAELRSLLALVPGAVRMVTLAPELPGAAAAIELLAGAGVVPAIGHTAASYAQTRAAVAAGARVATHLFNGMPPVHHRQPGPVAALLTAPEVVCELIADGVHLDDGALALAVAAAGPDRTALVTDAIAAAGAADGRYDLGGQPVVVAGGAARLAVGGALAGSLLTMDAAVRRAVGAGVPLPDVCRMAATTPARVLGLADTLGALAPGLRADVVVLDDALRVRRVMRAGAWVAPAGGA